MNKVEESEVKIKWRTLLRYLPEEGSPEELPKLGFFDEFCTSKLLAADLVKKKYSYLDKLRKVKSLIRVQRKIKAFLMNFLYIQVLRSR
jgi:hypothetical protein